MSQGDNDDPELQKRIQELNTKLTDFYRLHNPAKLSSVAATAAKYVNDEDVLWKELHKKYKSSIKDLAKVGTPGDYPAPVIVLSKSLGDDDDNDRTPLRISPLTSTPKKGGNSTPTFPHSGSGSSTNKSKEEIGTPKKEEEGKDINPFTLDEDGDEGDESVGEEEEEDESDDELQGPEPSFKEEDFLKVHLLAFYQVHNPERANEEYVDQILKTYEGYEKDLITKLEKKI